MASAIVGYTIFGGIMVLAVRSIVRGVRRGNREGWHFRAPWIRRLHGERDT